LETVLRRPIATVIGSDSSAAIAAVNKGVSTSLRHVRKNHRVSLASIHDACALSGTELVKVPTEINASDIFTKSLDAVRFALLRAMLGVFDPLEAPLKAPPTLLDIAMSVSCLGDPSCGSGSSTTAVGRFHRRGDPAPYETSVWFGLARCFVWFGLAR
jgi:hypothetical protein